MAGTVRERAFIASPVTSGAAQVVASPFQFLVEGEDNLRVRIWNTRQFATISVRGRQYLRDGSLVPFERDYTPTFDRLINTFLIPLSPGYVVTLSVGATGTQQIQHGHCFVQVDLVRGLDGPLVTLGTLLQGYVGNFITLAYPGSPIVSPLDGRGALDEILIAQPAAGAGHTTTVQTNRRYQILSAAAQLNTSGVVANRFASLGVANGLGNQIFRLAHVYPQAAGGFVFYSWCVGMPLGVATTTDGEMAGIPYPLVLKPLDVITSFVTSMDAADQWSAMTLRVESWIDPAV